MLTALGDTHGTVNLRLSDRARTVLEEAELLVHVGDFTTLAVYDGFKERARELIAVHGNSDTAELRGRLPAVRTVDWVDWRLLVVHGHEHDRTSLPLLARERGADLAIVGHTHRPGIERVGDLPIVKPGSHADPRGGPPTHAELRPGRGTLTVEVRTGEGETVDRERMMG
ncbi:metallophosphoesterase [Halorhabdus amylolytica]|uniref:metallophosphoesterase n=1 Tax=Halorhabdus amylolytica TaxID=2559573 RepID=UPI0010A9FFC7|nr:metallophosphoesterase [Halorhabdus amylolytica]